MPKKFGLDED